MNRSIVYALRFVGVRIKVTGEIPNNVSLPYIILANHQSLFDIPILHVLFARDLPRFVSKIELSKWIPSVSFNLRVGGNAIIDRSNPRQAISILKDFTRAMKDGRFPAVLFPEGTRARDGLLKSFRTSGTIAMLKDLPEAIVLPVMLDGGWRLSKSKTGLMPLPAEVNVVIGKPFGRDNKTEAELINESYNFILKSLIENRGTNNVTAVTANKCPNNENLAA